MWSCALMSRTVATQWSPSSRCVPAPPVECSPLDSRPAAAAAAATDTTATRLQLVIYPPSPLPITSQTSIPDADKFGHHDVVGATESGWKEQVFGRIRRVFGYGC